MSSPDGTFGPTIDTPQGTWSFGPNGETLLTNHMSGGFGKLYCWSAGVVYTQGAFDSLWYIWKGNNHWELFGDGSAPPIPLPVTPSLPQLVRRGAFFQLETGEHFSAREATFFRGYQRFLAGEDITPQLAELQDEGFNMIRVLGMCAQMFRLFPQEQPEFFHLLPAFLQLCARYGLYVEFVVFADATIVMPLAVDQLTHWARIGEALQGISNVLVEAVNEEDQPVNKVAAIQRLYPLSGMLCSHGSNGSERPPIRAPFNVPLQAGASGWWDYETAHWNDAFEWWRKVGHNAMEYTNGARYTSGQYNGQISIPASGVPEISNETTRPDKDNSLVHFYDMAAAATLLIAGVCFHSNEGKDAALLGASLVFAREFIKGCRSVPLEYQDGNYIRRDDLLGPNLRVYERRLPDGRGWVVKVRH